MRQARSFCPSLSRLPGLPRPPVRSSGSGGPPSRAGRAVRRGQSCWQLSKVLLENYGYPVVDLGRDVEPAAVVEAAKKHAAPLVGLSALMTTTLGSMEQTIALLREEKVSCKVVVGGAVLTADYAKTIGADFYAKDAKESVDVARRVIG